MRPLISVFLNTKIIETPVSFCLVDVYQRCKTEELKILTKVKAQKRSCYWKGLRKKRQQKSSIINESAWQKQLCIPE